MVKVQRGAVRQVELLAVLSSEHSFIFDCEHTFHHDFLSYWTQIRTKQMKNRWFYECFQLCFNICVSDKTIAIQITHISKFHVSVASSNLVNSERLTSFLYWLHQNSTKWTDIRQFSVANTTVQRGWSPRRLEFHLLL